MNDIEDVLHAANMLPQIIDCLEYPHALWLNIPVCAWFVYG